MASVLVLIGCFGLGIVARRFSGLPPDSHRVLNAWVLYVSMPALVIRLIHSVPLRAELAWAVMGVWLVFAIPAVVGLWWVSSTRAAKRGAVGAMVLCMGLGNTAFVGYPLLGLLGGDDAVGLGAVVDQLGTFVMLSVGAVPFATYLSGHEVSLRGVLRRLVTFPPMIALVVAIASRPVTFSPVLDEVLERLAAMLTPLAIASVGWQFAFEALKGNGRLVALGLGWKMVVAPLLVFAFLKLVGSGAAEVERVAVAQAAMAPMVTAGVLATEFNLDSRLAAALIAVGTPLSLVTVPLWWWLLR